MKKGDFQKGHIPWNKGLHGDPRIQKALTAAHKAKIGKAPYNKSFNKVICLRCSKEFFSAPSNNSKYCSKKCYRPSIFSNCKQCGIIMKISPYMLTNERKVGSFCSRKCMYLFRRTWRKEKSPIYKGNNAKYSAIHMWLTANYEKPKICNHCGSKRRKRYEWANKTGLYLRNRDDWLILCTSCHRRYDNKNNIKKHERFKAQATH